MSIFADFAKNLATTLQHFYCSSSALRHSIYSNCRLSLSDLHTFVQVASCLLFVRRTTFRRNGTSRRTRDNRAKHRYVCLSACVRACERACVSTKSADHVAWHVAQSSRTLRAPICRRQCVRRRCHASTLRICIRLLDE